MKLKKVIIIIMAVLMILTTFSKDIISIAKSENIEIHNKEILGKVKILQDIAEKYIKDNNITEITATDLCMQYIRKERYNSSFWNRLLGSIDTKFVTYLQGKENVPTFGNEVLLDPKTGKNIDFVHMIAPLNAYLKNGDKVLNIVSTDYAGWAGDLITLLEEVTVYRTGNDIEDKSILQEYSNSLLGTNNSSTCSSSDILADLDAIALYKDNNNKIKEDLYNALYKYYISTDSKYNANNRLVSARTILGSTKDIVKEKAKGLLTNTNFGTINIKSSLFKNSNIADKVTVDDINVVSQSFANYVYGVPYLKLQKSKGNGTVGKADIDIKIIESNANLKNESIEIEDMSIAKAEIHGEYLRITPLDGGETTITIYSEDKTISSTYKLISKNVAPSITKDLNETYELILNVEKEISIEAEGTNNVYVWYMQNPETGTFYELAQTSENTYKILPTLEMNNTYIKCGIKNNGNEEIFSIAAKLVIDANKNEEENTTDNNNTQEEQIDNTTQDDIQDEENKNTTDTENNVVIDNNNNNKDDEKEISSSDNSSDEKPTILPYTGNEKNILLVILLIVFVAIFAYGKLKKYQGI